ncbi:tetratricopeptide (TPR) repeat protein [Epilithonimonas hungarica]|uniref:tetratricopeptide repeat protein n=1 Tax=Epilithonimonas hungarica TaxID=454006 RepID=UPI0027886CD6|nr:tetratricopeptide repeat protein [Epilithonimonas hungarica]MDP9955926.1 tetratricopeptide (TPR) repeat protein [Epilithonimonas hungarica]
MKLLIQKIKNVLIVLCVLFIINSQTFSAQNKNEPHLDSLFLMMNSNPEKVIRLGKELYKKYKGNPKMEISILTIIGSSYSVKKDYEKAIEYAFKTRDISQKINDYPTQIQVAGFIGEKYHNLNIYSKAKYYADEAYDLIEKHPLPDSLKFYKGNILFLKALVYRDELGCDFAKTYYEKALEVYIPALKNRDMLRFSIADIYNEIGGCFLEQDQLEAARGSFEKSLQYAIKGNYALLNAESLAGLGRINFLQKDYLKAKKEFDKAILILKSNKVENANPEVYKYISENYYALNDIENHTLYLNLYKQKTNTDISAKKKSVNEIIVKQTAKGDSENNNTAKYWIIIVLCILIVLVIYQIVQTKAKIRKLKKQIPEDNMHSF